MTNRNTSKPTATPYKRGTNEILDRIMSSTDVVFIVQGSKGRKPILAATAEEAKAKYVERFL